MKEYLALKLISSLSHRDASFLRFQELQVLLHVHVRQLCGIHDVGYLGAVPCGDKDVGDDVTPAPAFQIELIQKSFLFLNICKKKGRKAVSLLLK